MQTPLLAHLGHWSLLHLVFIPQFTTMAVDSAPEQQLEITGEQSRWLEPYLGHLWSVLASSTCTLDVEACDTNWITVSMGNNVVADK
jgi:hypothetical protein